MRITTMAVTIALSAGGAIFHASGRQDFNEQTITQSAELTEANRLESSASDSFSKRHYKEAAELLKQSLTLKEKVLGPDHPDVATTIHNLANVYQKAGKLEEAEPSYLRAISIRENKLGTDNPDSIQVLKDYACLNLRQGRTELDMDKEPDEHIRELRYRALCWLGGLTNKCVEQGNILAKQQGILSKAVQPGMPAYPTAARGQHLSAKVFVAVLIDEMGMVIAARRVCGTNAVFDAVSVEAARASKFTPTKVNGQAIQVARVISYKFIAQ